MAGVGQPMGVGLTAWLRVPWGRGSRWELWPWRVGPAIMQIGGKGWHTTASHKRGGGLCADTPGRLTASMGQAGGRRGGGELVEG